MDRWIALFSQTGSEIVALSKELGRWPDHIFTNNNKLDTINPELTGKYKVMSHRGIEETLNIMAELTGSSLVTLHGYLRILSKDVCETGMMIYNGHPGLITVYPELKGKDPQERVIGNNYDIIGSVVHRVTEGVDEGGVVSSAHVKNIAKDTDEVYNMLRETSKQAWLEFLKDKV